MTLPRRSVIAASRPIYLDPAFTADGILAPPGGFWPRRPGARECWGGLIVADEVHAVHLAATRQGNRSQPPPPHPRFRERGAVHPRVVSDSGAVRKRSTCFKDASFKQVDVTSGFLKLDDILALT